MTWTDQPVPLRIARQATLTPDATAVSGASNPVTYRELDSRARAVAHELRSAGAGPEDTVLLAVRRGTAWAVGLLGIWYSGAAVVPVDLSAPDDRLAALVAASGTRYAVVHGHSAAAELQLRCAAELFWAADEKVPSSAPPGTGPLVSPAPASLAYVLFTSGSTGKPKPVAVAHSSLEQQSMVMAQRYGLRETDRVLQFAAPAFDVSLEEAVPTWCTGGAAVFLPDNVLSPAELEPFLVEHAVTLVNLPTPYWAQWAKDVERRPRELPGSLRQVVIGSDSGRIADLDRWFAAGGGPLISSYGLTESTIIATTHEPDRTTLSARKPDTTIPIGRPLPDVRAHVLDGRLRPVPPGVVGELYLGGPCLARGYQSRPAMTAERFVADPHSGVPGARMYRTGDRVRLAADGELEFLGRSDDQVKIRGHRVETREVEAGIAAHPDVVDVVVRVTHLRGEPQLVAYIAQVPAGGLDAEALRRYLAERYPAYLIPARVVMLSELPRTAGGKLNPQALPHPDSGVQAEATTVPGPPRPVGSSRP